ncbi:MAG: PAS domain-containing protein, partial [Candidatus Binatia bacterium]
MNVRPSNRTDPALPGEERAYRSSYDDAPLAYIACDAGRVIREVNRACCELTGYAAAELCGRPFTTLAPTPEWQSACRAAFDAAERNLSELVDLQATRRDGKPLWMRATVRALRTADGALAGYSVLAADVTSVKEAERDLRQSEALYRDLYEHAPLAYFTFGADGTLWRWNARGPEITGYTDEELRGMRTIDFHTDAPENREAFARLESELFRDGKDLFADVEARRKDGTIYRARVSLSPLRDADGRIIGAR